MYDAVSRQAHGAVAIARALLDRVGPWGLAGNGGAVASSAITYAAGPKTLSVNAGQILANGSGEIVRTQVASGAMDISLLEAAGTPFYVFASTVEAPPAGGVAVDSIGSDGRRVRLALVCATVIPAGIWFTLFSCSWTTPGAPGGSPLIDPGPSGSETMQIPIGTWYYYTDPVAPNEPWIQTVVNLGAAPNPNLSLIPGANDYRVMIPLFVPAGSKLYSASVTFDLTGGGGAGANTTVQIWKRVGAVWTAVGSVEAVLFNTPAAAPFSGTVTRTVLAPADCQETDEFALSVSSTNYATTVNFYAAQRRVYW